MSCPMLMLYTAVLIVHRFSVPCTSYLVSFSPRPLYILYNFRYGMNNSFSNLKPRLHPVLNLNRLPELQLHTCPE